MSDSDDSDEGSGSEDEISRTSWAARKKGLLAQRAQLMQLAAAITSRKRAAAMAMVLHAAAGQQGPQGPKRRDLSPFNWENHVARLTAAEFKLRYRLTAESFYTLLDMLEPALQVDSAKQARCSKGSVMIEPCTKLAVRQFACVFWLVDKCSI